MVVEAVVSSKRTLLVSLSTKRRGIDETPSVEPYRQFIVSFFKKLNDRLTTPYNFNLLIEINSGVASSGGGRKAGLPTSCYAAGVFLTQQYYQH
ncbi:hypothetical protein U1Q18_049956 [Sarracenia purpurea var. burkii]